MKRRIITGVIMAVILVPALLFPQLTILTQLLLLLLVVGASHELLAMYNKEKKLHPVIRVITVLLTLGLYCSIVATFQPTFNHLAEIGAIPESKNQFTIVYRFLRKIRIVDAVTPFSMLAATLIVLMATMVFCHDLTVPDIGKLLTCIIYVGICAGSFTVLWYAGVRFVIYLLIITVSTDTFALVFGLLLGKHKMAPYISPKKTWEGAVGGSAVAVVLGFLFLFFYQYIADWTGQFQHTNFFEGLFAFDKFTLGGQIAFIIILTLAISVCSQIGDLIASKLKRNYGIKDYSNIFPGHGGILDRFDSIFFASAIFLLFLIIEQNMFGMFLAVGGF